MSALVICLLDNEWKKNRKKLITSKNERVNWLREQGNLTIKRKKEREGGWKGGSAGEALIIQNVCSYYNSRGNANEILGQCQYLSNYTPTPPLTTNSQLMTSQVNVGLEEG